MEHTKTPWAIHTDRINSIYEIRSTAELKGICYVGHGHSNWADGEIEANARRIVAAVNAVEGIETEMLEALPLNFKEHALELDRMKAQNSRLRQALKRVVGALTEMEANNAQCFHGYEMHEPTDDARAALAETEEETE